ncbi:MAG: glycosyltransferase family 4 protein [Firmicutes bacterium]|nr:glycosyltransferase family 4 protein [Bacillota bacterium]
MRIAIYTNAYKPIVSGVVNAIALLRQGFLARGHEVIVLAPDYYGYRDQEEGIYRFPAVDLTRKVRFPVAIPWSPRLSRVIRTFRPEVIHAHHPFVLGPLALRTARHLGVPLVYTFHTQYEQYAHYVPLPPRLVKWFTRHRIRRFVEAADAVTTPAVSIRDLLAGYGIRREILVLPNPIDLSRFARTEGPSVRRQLGLDEEELVLSFVGRLGIEKNLGFMLEAFALLREMAPELPLRLVLVGAGPEETRLRELGEELGLGDRLIFTGSVPYQTVPSYLAAADLFLMTSVTEVKPLVLLEAMAAGLPVVAVRAAGAMDTLTDGLDGLLVPLDRGAFAQAVLSLLRDEERRRAMGRAARATVERYALDRVAAEFLRLYEEARSRRPGAG